MDDLELKDQAIKEFVNLQRLKIAENKEKEIEYQEKVSSCAVRCSKEHLTHLSIRKTRAIALLRLLTQTHFAH